MDKFSATITIDSKPAEVWSALTDPGLMARWLGEPEMKIEVDTDWKINSPILIRGYHHVKFENRGVVLQYEKDKRLSYSHLSSISRLPDTPENHSIFEFTLTPLGRLTQVTLAIRNFPTESIRKHLEFYWKTTLVTIKELVEKEKDRNSREGTGCNPG